MGQYRIYWLSGGREVRGYMEERMIELVKIHINNAASKLPTYNLPHVSHTTMIITLDPV